VQFQEKLSSCDAMRCDALQYDAMRYDANVTRLVLVSRVIMTCEIARDAISNKRSYQQAMRVKSAMDYEMKWMV